MSVGIVVGLGVEVIYALLLTVVLLIVGEAPMSHLRWYGGAFIVLILILRYYAKSQKHLNVVKSLIAVFFLTFLAFIFILVKAHLL